MMLLEQDTCMKDLTQEFNYEVTTCYNRSRSRCIIGC
jgi:hypothetical protein